MSVKVENLEKNKIKLEIEVEPEVLDEGLNKSFKKNAGRFSMPGFRKGKVPRHMVERYYGVEVLYEDAIDFIFPDSYQKALEETKIEPVSSPELDIIELEKGKPFIFSATVFVKPKVTLGSYKGVEAKFKDVLITGDEIDAELKNVAERNSRMIPVEDRPAEIEDTVIIDFEGYIDGIPFEGGKGENHSLVLGSKQFIEGFEEQIVGKNVNDDFEIEVTFPEEYHSEEFQGKKATFQIYLHAIKRKELPEINDEFAQDASEFDTLAEYQDSIRKELTEKAEQKSKDDFENDVLNLVTADCEIDIPEVMIEDQFTRNYKNMEMMLAYQNMNIPQYLEMTGMTMEQFKAPLWQRAETEVRMQLVIEEIGKAEGIEPSEEDVEKELAKRAEKNRRSVDEFKASLSEERMGYIRDALRAEKTVDFIVQNAKKQ